MHRRIPLAASAVLALTLPLAACTSSSALDEPPERSLVVWVDEERAAALEALTVGFEESTGTQVDVVGQASEGLRDTFIRAVDTYQGPDVIIGAHDWLGQLVADGVVLPLDIADPSAFVPAGIEAVSYDGFTYGVPLSTENVGLVRNNAIVTETPETFDELLTQGEALVRAGQAQRAIVVQQGDDGDPYHLYALQTSMGAPVFATAEDGSYTTELALGGDDGRAFARRLAELGRRGVLDTALTSDAATALFTSGGSPYMITGPWNTTEFVKAGMDITVLPVPSLGDAPAQPFVGVQGAYVSVVSKRAAQAKEFVTEYLASAEIQLGLYEATGRAPALVEALDQISDDPAIIGLAEAGADGAPMPAIPQMSVVWLYWGTTERQIFAGQGDPAELWDRMVADIELAIVNGV